MSINEFTADDLAERLYIKAFHQSAVDIDYEDSPQIKKGNIVIVPFVSLGETDVYGKYENGIAVTHTMLELWGMKEDEIFRAAVENSNRLFPAVLESLENYSEVAANSVKLFSEDDFDISQVKVLTNEGYYNGASVMFYVPEMLDKVADIYGSNQFYLLPSSYEEVFCVPVSTFFTESELQALFTELCESDEKISRFSSEIWKYDAARREVSELDGESFSLSLTENMDETQSKNHAR